MNQLTNNSPQIVHLTHNDADALGCVLALEYATPNVPKQTFYTNYQDIAEQVSNVCDYISSNIVKFLLISDISFANNKAMLYKLQELSTLFPTLKMVFIDHHAYPDGFFDDITIKYIHSLEYSATKLVKQFFNVSHPTLDGILTLINNFDIWLEKEPSFPLSIALNHYFWYNVSFGEKIISIEELANKIKNNKYKLPEDFNQFYKKYKQESSEFVTKARAKKLIHSDGLMTAAFVDEYFNEILYEEFSKGIQFVVIANSYGITRFRFNSNSIFSDKEKEAIKLELIGSLEIGHLNAFSDKIQNSTFEKIIQRISDVNTILKKYNKQGNK